MNITRSTSTKSRLATIAAMGVVAFSSLAGPAIAAPAGPSGTIGTPAPKPTVMTQKEWKHCWSVTYANWRKDGGSIQGAQAAADLTCGTQP